MSSEIAQDNPGTSEQRPKRLVLKSYQAKMMNWLLTPGHAKEGGTIYTRAKTFAQHFATKKIDVAG